MVETPYWYWESAISKEMCELIIKSTDWSNTEKGSYGYGYKDNKVRDVDIVWTHGMEPINCITKCYNFAANELAGWNFTVNGMEPVQMSRYGVGGHHNWHVDMQPASLNNGLHRKITISILLSDPADFDGGHFQMEGFEEQGSLFKKQGDVLVFPSFINHRVTDVTRGTRFSAVSWAFGPTFK